MRIAIDLDGTICEIKKDGESYADVNPLPGAADSIRKLRAAGNIVIILTARNMGTCQSNLGRVMKNVGRVTLEWLDRHGIEYDEIYFGKPNAEIYIDDRGFRFSGWEELAESTIREHARER